MVEIFTVGGGDYLVNVFQAVAAWTGNGRLQEPASGRHGHGAWPLRITLAFNQDWRAWINWFLGATLIYSCLMVPRLDVHVTDRLNPSLAPANVSNVPLGLALMASFTSQVGDYLTGSAEVVFGLPGDLNYSKNGMIYGARLYDATRSLRISDPEFAANLDEHFRQCVFYDVLLGRYSMKELAETSDIWATIAPGSQARPSAS
jgi:conjugal transfer mating pair stabilization protein TraG